MAPDCMDPELFVQLFLMGLVQNTRSNWISTTHLSCFNATEVLCCHALVTQALYEVAQLCGVLDTDAEQDVCLFTS